MMWLLVLGIYLIGWFVSSVITAKQLSYGDIEFPEACMGACVGLFWPLLIFPAGIYAAVAYLNNREERVKHQRLLTDRELAALETQAGIVSDRYHY